MLSTSICIRTTNKYMQSKTIRAAKLITKDYKKKSVPDFLKKRGFQENREKQKEEEIDDPLLSQSVHHRNIECI